MLLKVRQASSLSLGPTHPPSWFSETGFPSHDSECILDLQEEKRSLLVILRQAASNSDDATGQQQAAQSCQIASVQAEPGGNTAQQATATANVADAPKRKGKQGSEAEREWGWGQVVCQDGDCGFPAFRLSVRSRAHCSVGDANYHGPKHCLKLCQKLKPACCMF